ncbi:hypothetical protein COCON_G00041240 [Conger conger]|uniref:Uncharacterized protein n=1 Tax=Conger conger TaxID=82655 RepID=A0A9Q1DTN8_CONCO|nr:hypothetical protein COCON_G00041240 [Conger conger]
MLRTASTQQSHVPNKVLSECTARVSLTLLCASPLCCCGKYVILVPFRVPTADDCSCGTGILLGSSRYPVGDLLLPLQKEAKTTNGKPEEQWRRAGGGPAGVGVLPGAGGEEEGSPKEAAAGGLRGGESVRQGEGRQALSRGTGGHGVLWHPHVGPANRSDLHQI